MKIKRKHLILIIISSLVLIGLLIGLVIVLNQNNQKSVFDYENAKQVLSDGYKRSIDERFKLTGIKEFGYTGDAEIDAATDTIDSTWFVTVLSDDTCKLDSDQIKKLVDDFVKAYSKEFDFSFIEHPSLVPYCDEETYSDKPDDDCKALVEGYVLFEYSYRDKDGVLWLAQIFSPREDVLEGLLVKQFNDEDFNGFIPMVIMKEGEQK